MKVVLYDEVVTSFASRLHHHASPDGVEGVGNEAGEGAHALGNHPAHDDVCVLGVRKHSCQRNTSQNVTDYFRMACSFGLLRARSQKLTLGCVVDAKVSGSVDDDALHRNSEALVQTLDAV